MSSFIRRIERTTIASLPVHPVMGRDGGVVRYERNPPRATYYMGRGSKLGVSNPKDAALLARKARDAKWGRA